ncbi:alphaK A2 [Puccinia sorghi]|uniref:AlphaK A2 n=1 Tax=Puccinia sorghi TaxID=27349 RepID=A0A0L6V5J3_9BASI|nr:alphaK A2 [Puccinia sorghi]
MTFHRLQIMQPTLECTKLVHSSSMNSKTSFQQIQIPLIQSKIDILPQLVCHWRHQLTQQWADGNNAAPGIQLFLENQECNDVCRALNLGQVIDLQWQRPSESSEAQVPHSNISVSLAHLLIENEKLPEAQDLFIPSQVILPVPSSVANPGNNSD